VSVIDPARALMCRERVPPAADGSIETEAVRRLALARILQ
jgi:hypothetical protein